MARPLRLEFPGAIYHITSRGNAREEIFFDEVDRKIFLSILADTVKRYNLIFHAYCLMGNHYHLMVETPDANLSLGMRQLNGVYTQSFNRRHQRVGHIFQGRYKSILVEKGPHLLELCRYIVLNPVKAGMVKRPEQWNWSSYKTTAGMSMAAEFLSTDWILKQFSPKKTEAKKRYVEFVNKGLDQRLHLGERAEFVKEEKKNTQKRNQREYGCICKRGGPEDALAVIKPIAGGKQDGAVFI